MECIVIGEVRSPVTEAVDMNWGEVVSEIVLKPEYAPGPVSYTHLTLPTILLV